MEISLRRIASDRYHLGGGFSLMQDFLSKAKLDVLDTGLYRAASGGISLRSLCTEILIDNPCQRLNALAPLTVGAPLGILTLGEYDAGTGKFLWNPFRVVKVIVEPNPDDPHGPRKPTQIIQRHAHVTVALAAVTVKLVNTTAPIAFTANDHTSVAPAGAPAVTVQGPFTSGVLFSLQSGSTLLVSDQLVLDSSPLLEAGCIVIPAVPVAIIYQPPTTEGFGTLETDQTTGVALTKVISDTFPQATPSSLSDVTMALHTFGDLLATIGDVGGDATKTFNTVGDAINLLADAVGDIPTASTGWGLQVHTEHTFEVTASVGESWSSVPQLGPGAGDVILYLQDVTFLVYKDKDHTLITPMGFQGNGPQDVTAARLQPGASNPPALSDEVRAYLLGLDPVASGDAQAVATSNRYSLVQQFTEDNQGVRRKLAWGYTVTESTVEETLPIPQTDGPPITIGLASKSGRQGRTITASVEAIGPFDFEVYYDSLFGTFAYRDVRR